MSMISAQCDELRSMAASVGLEVPQAATLMMDAADTIWELRDDLQRANAENAKLRRELESVGIAAYLYGRDDLKSENAKLRELAEKAWKAAERLCQAFDGPCRSDGVTIYEPCPMSGRDEECIYGQLQRELRECGVEVDE